MTGIATKINFFSNSALATAGGGGGLLWWLDTHSAGLGVIAVFIVALTGMVSKYLVYRELKRHHVELEDKEK